MEVGIGGTIRTPNTAPRLPMIVHMSERRFPCPPLPELPDCALLVMPRSSKTANTRGRLECLPPFSFRGSSLSNLLASSNIDVMAAVYISTALGVSHRPMLKSGRNCRMSESIAAASAGTSRSSILQSPYSIRSSRLQKNASWAELKSVHRLLHGIVTPTR